MGFITGNVPNITQDEDQKFKNSTLRCHN